MPARLQKPVWFGTVTPFAPQRTVLTVPAPLTVSQDRSALRYEELYQL